MSSILKLLHGATPTVDQLVLTYCVAALGAAIAIFVAGYDAVGIVLALVSADWFGGVVANSARSTRAYWASLPKSVVYLFCGVHVAELPIVWWLVGGALEFAYLWPVVIAKVAVFLIGQAEHRT